MGKLNEEFANQSLLFSAKLYNEISKPYSNVIYSPFSIQACVAMARMGATGETAHEMDYGLNLISGEVTSIADSFYNILAKYKDGTILKIANKIYVKDGYIIQKEFNEIIANKFLSAVDQIDFAKNTDAANTINNWVESKTNNLIKNLISPSDMGGLTRLVLVNATYFKGKLCHPYIQHGNQSEDFYLNEVDIKKVPMMNFQADFPYVDLPEFDATAIQIPYKNCDLSMLVILPNSRTGLKSLEKKLKTVLLTEIISKMTANEVQVKFPKFTAEFSVELNGTLQNLGMPRMFSENAEFPKMLESAEGIAVSKVIHKAYIDISDEGTEAAAEAIRSSSSPDASPKIFIADKPCYYAITTSDNLIVFTGIIQTF